MINYHIRKKWLQVFYRLVLGQGLLVLVLHGCSSAPAMEETESLPPVKTTEVASVNVPRVLEVAADVYPENEVVLMPEVTGVIEAVHGREGDAITTGQLLITINDEDMLNTVLQAESAVAAAEAQAVGADQTWRAAKAHFERMEQLWATKSISAGAYDEVRAGYEQARAAHLAAQSQLKAAGARLAMARSSLRKCSIYSPFDGFIASRLENPGAVVQTMPPTSIMVVVQVDPIRIKARVPELDFFKLTAGMSVDILLDALPDKKFTGSISRLGPVVDPVSRTGTVEMTIANSDAQIKPGMAARVRIDLGTRTYLCVPRTSLLTMVSDRQSEVFVLRPDNIAERRKISLAGYHEELALVEDGVKAGDQVISRGVHAVVDGGRVRVAA
ncbi:efflux RND transporter periplasmic adaptor subunit [bacterium]|nr:efflux RND transporter periplasmic adaptor subunit [candidate division CSSED10-310 bacterium]